MNILPFLVSAEEHEGIPDMELSARDKEQAEIDSRHEEIYEEEARISRILEDELHEEVMNAEDRQEQSRSFYEATLKQLEPHITNRSSSSLLRDTTISSKAGVALSHQLQHVHQKCTVVYKYCEYQLGWLT